MKRVYALFVVVLMLFSVLPAVFAEDTDDSSTNTETSDVAAAGGEESGTGEGTDTTEEATEEEAEEVEEEAIDDETEEETELISESNFGATVRLLQLEKAVTKSYLIGREVINVLSEKGEDVSELESLLVEIEVLKDELSTLDPNSETAVDDFVNIKRDIKDLNKQFKRIASPLLSANDKQAIRDAIKDNEALASLNQEIRDELRELNANRVGKALDRMGASDPELVDKIESGDATPAEVKAALKEAYKGLGAEEKKAARAKVKAAIKERKELRKKVAEKVKAEHLEVRRERLENRLNQIPVKYQAKAKERIDKAVDRLKRVENKLKDKVAANKERLVNIKEDIKAKREQVREDFKERREQIKAQVEERKENIKDGKAQIASNIQAKKEVRQPGLQATSDTAGGDAE